MNLRIEYQLTPADLEEAMHAQQAEHLAQQAKRVKKQSPIARIIVPMAVPLIALLFLGNINWGRFDVYGRPRPPYFVVINLVLPGVVFAAFLLAMALVRRKQGVRGHTTKPMIFFLMSLLPLAIIAGSSILAKKFLPQQAVPPSLRYQYDWFAILIPHVGWAGILGFIVFVNARQVATRAKQLWDSQPGMHRPRTAEIDDAGIFIDEVVVQHRHQWLAFLRVAETTNLFLLCPSDVAFEIVPKRAFGSREAIDEARAFFTGRIVDREKANLGFSVVQRAEPVCESTQPSQAPPRQAMPVQEPTIQS